MIPGGNTECRKEWRPLEKENINECCLLLKNTGNVEYEIYVELKYMTTIMEASKMEV